MNLKTLGALHKESLYIKDILTANPFLYVFINIKILGYRNTNGSDFCFQENHTEMLEIKW
jgi:hypothetical protein